MPTIQNNDLDILARTIYGEARGELAHPNGGIQSLWAVGLVIKNRSQLPRYSPYIHRVCTQPWQFSCWNDTDPNRAQLLSVDFEDKAFRTCYLAATQVLFSNLNDCTYGADHYHSKDIAPPYWAVGRPPTTMIGNHVFYKLGV